MSLNSTQETTPSTESQKMDVETTRESKTPGLAVKPEESACHALLSQLAMILTARTNNSTSRHQKGDDAAKSERHLLC